MPAFKDFIGTDIFKDHDSAFLNHLNKRQPKGRLYYVYRSLFIIYRNE